MAVMTTFGQSWFCEKMGKWNLVRSWNFEGKPFPFCACVCQIRWQINNLIFWNARVYQGLVVFFSIIGFTSITIIGLHLEEACMKDLAIKVVNMGFYKCVEIWVKFYKIITKWATIATYWARYYFGFSFCLLCMWQWTFMTKNCYTKDRRYLDTCFTSFNRSFH